MKYSCSQCGADVRFEEDTCFVVCAHCDASLYVEVDQTIQHFAPPPVLSPKDLGPALKAFLNERGLTRPARIDEHRLRYFPFWRFHTVSGDKLSLPAAVTAMDELNIMARPSGNFLPLSRLNIRKQDLLPPEILLESARARASALGLHEAIVRTDLIHLPLYFVTYHYQGQPYRAAVNAVSGKVHTDRLPVAPFRAKGLFFGLLFLLTLAVLLLEGLLIPGNMMTLLAFFGTSLLIFGGAHLLLKWKGW